MNKLTLRLRQGGVRVVLLALPVLLAISSLTALLDPTPTYAAPDTSQLEAIYCGEAATPATQGKYDGCKADVKKAFETCYKDSDSTDAIATCLKQQLALSSNLVNTNIPVDDLSQVITDIKESGTTDGEAASGGASGASDIASAKTEEECKLAGGVWKPDEAGSGSTSGAASGGDTSGAAGQCTEPDQNEGEDKCNVEGIGWFLCPTLNFIAKIYDNLFIQLSNRFLVIQDRMFQSDPASSDNTTVPTKVAWEKFRDLANIVFVGVFLLVVYSQVSSAGLSNYGIKKLLPRLILTAVLVNLSYWLCAFAVDLSNLLGYGMKEMFDYVGGSVVGTGGEGTTTTQVVSASTVIAAALAVAGGLVMLALFTGVVFFGVLALILTLLILILRQALVVILVIVSPLAFVALLLPNTKKFFARWWKLFFSLLILFPIIGVVFGGTSLVTTILNETDANIDSAATQPAAGGGDQPQAAPERNASSEMEVIILGIQAVPLLVVPFLLQNSLSAFGAMGGRISAVVNGMNSMAKRSGKRRASRLWNRSTLGQAYKTGVAARDARAVSRFGRRAKNGNMLARSGAIAGGGKAGLDELGRRGNVLSEKTFNEDKEAYMMSWGEADYNKISDIATGKRAAANDAERTAAIEYIMQKGSLKEKMAAVGTSASVVANGDSHALAAITDGMAKNGLQEILGSKTFMLVRAGKVDGVTRNENTGADKVTIDERIGENAAEGAINPGALTKSSSASSFINDVANRGAIDAKGLDNLSKSITAARQDKTKNIGEDMKGHFSNIQQLSMKANAIPSGSTPAAATPRHTPGGKPANNAPLTPSATKNPIPTSKPVNITPPAGGGVGVSVPSTGGAVFGSGVNTPPPPAAGKPVNIPPTNRRK